MDLPKFKNVTEDKVIEAQFSNTISYVRVNHYKKDTNEKIADSEILTGNYNSNYETSPAIVDGYELERNVSGEFVKPENASGQFKTTDIEINYYYQPKQVDVITSYELENGTKIISDNKQKVEYGKDYTTVPGTVDNKYELVSTPENASGKVTTEAPVNVRLKSTNVIVNHYILEFQSNIVGKDYTTKRVPNNEGGIVEKEIINGTVDEAYTTRASDKIAQNYELDSVPTNATGNMTLDPIEVNYYYKKKIPRIYNSKYEKIGPKVVTNRNNKFVYTVKYTEH